MPISIRVRSERHELVAALEAVSETLPDAPEPLTAADLPTEYSRYPMLACVDPDGNTIFNGRQAREVLKEATRLAQQNAGDNAWTARARAVEVLIAAHMRKPHRYLWFVGD